MDTPSRRIQHLAGDGNKQTGTKATRNPTIVRNLLMKPKDRTCKWFPCKGGHEKYKNCATYGTEDRRHFNSRCMFLYF